MSDNDTTTPQQRAYWHALHCLIAEAERPADGAEMTQALKVLYGEARERAKLRRQPYNDWQDTVANRMARLMRALAMDVPANAEHLGRDRTPA